ncbi:MAG: DUF4166 domain-containing protein [Phenylobacterium sp.]|uniref:DUF4166 domain-containing protein n=1 Tax=Phenylobacterium sp. TaxID=1871053 RepID=UPI002736D9A2|nr:DUF4166 domain-containing protein [Phenylobacterium sp.]MDP3746175.1 DUF4166 domain-containing protein [Phenylobacterium sp.]
MTHRILLVGATGAFGRRLARLLAVMPGIELVLAARREAPLQALAAELGSGVQIAAFDRERPETLTVHRPWAVVDAAGPFQRSDLRLPRAAIACGAHYVDLSDARDFVAGFPDALGAEARAAGVLAVAGASSTPALSNAVLDRLTADWRAVDQVTVAISPGARAPRGLSVMQAILSYVGQPVRLFTGGRWRDAPGWSGVRRLDFPGLGSRLASLCETPDLDILPARFAVRREARFMAGLELAPLHLGLWLLSFAVRWRLLTSLAPLSRPLLWAAGLVAGLGSDRGGMLVAANGEGPDGGRVAARWGLWAEDDAGPYVPVAAAAAMLRGLANGEIGARGARACVGLLTLEQILAELAHLPIFTRVDAASPGHPSLLRRVLGSRVEALPVRVARVHAGQERATFHGRGRARGSRSPPARLARAFGGLPEPGDYPNLKVDIVPDATGETWTRRFGARAFRSRLASLPAVGEFEERVWPLAFAFRSDLAPDGFRWRLLRWRLGPLRLPMILAPRIRAITFARDGVYRFRVLVAHPALGTIFAYAGRLEP